MSTQIGTLQQEYRGRSGLGYSIELSHAGLHKHRVIKGSDQSIVLAKARLQSAEWNEQWLKKRDAAARTAARSHRVQQAQANKEAKRRYLEEQKAEALRRTTEARALHERLSSALAATLSYDDAIDFESLKDRSAFPKEKPRKQSLPPPPSPQPIPPAPRRDDPQYQPQLGLLDKLLSSRRAAKQAAAEASFDKDFAEWTRQKDRVEEANRVAADFYARQTTELDVAHVQAVRSWEAERADYLAEKERGHAAVDAFRVRYESREPGAIVEYCDMVLAGSDYPDCMPQEFELDFNPETGILAVDYHLPAPDDLPTLTDVKYVQSDDSFSEKHLTEGQKAKLYDELLYQVTLRTVHELFEADRVGVLRRLYSTASSHPLIAARGRRRPPAFSRFRRSAIRSWR